MLVLGELHAFRFRALRFEFRAQRPLRLAPLTAANTLRGAFGDAFRRLASEMKSEALYRDVFEPVIEDAPSGFRSPPRPFVFRPRWIGDGESAPVTQFALDVHLFDLREGLPAQFASVFREWGKEGSGMKGIPVKTTAVRWLRLDRSAAVIYAS